MSHTHNELSELTELSQRGLRRAEERTVQR